MITVYADGLVCGYDDDIIILSSVGLVLESTIVSTN